MKKSLAFIMSLIMIFSTFSVCAVSASAAAAAPAAVATQAVELENDFSLLFKGAFRNLINHILENIGMKKSLMVTEVEIETKKITMNQNESKLLTANIKPAGAKNKTIKWVSENPAVVSVSENGFITCKGIGQTTIYAIAEDGGFYDFCVVTTKKSETIASFNCGNNSRLTIYKNGNLIVSGTGKMYDNYISEDTNSYNLPEWSKFSSSVKTIIIEQGITHIGDLSFYEFSNVENIRIADSVTSIGKYAFAHCNNLTTVNLSNNITIIDEGAFLMTKINEIKLPSKLDIVGDYAFAFCFHLKEVDVPDGTTSIGKYAFPGVEKPYEFTITLPVSLKFLDEKAFGDRSNSDAVIHVQYKGTEHQWKQLTGKTVSEWMQTASYDIKCVCV